MTSGCAQPFMGLVRTRSLPTVCSSSHLEGRCPVAYNGPVATMHSNFNEARPVRNVTVVVVNFESSERPLAVAGCAARARRAGRRTWSMPLSVVPLQVRRAGHMALCRCSRAWAGAVAWSPGPARGWGIPGAAQTGTTQMKARGCCY